MEHPCHGRCITEFSKNFHDPVARYVEKLCSENGGLAIYRKEQSFSHSLLPFSSSLHFFIKHENKICIWNHLLDWIHWKSEVT